MPQPTSTSVETGTQHKVTYCRICEPLCGLVATVEDGVVTKLRPDDDHPLSQGQACPKGIAFLEINNDPDRLTHPVRRRADGEFERISWEEAYAEISQRLRRVMKDHGKDSVGMYFGNPAAFSYSHTLWIGGLSKSLGTKHLYSAGSQDINARFVASKLLYGSLSQLPFPDLPRTDFLLIVGANPVVSHGSALNAPRIKDQLRAIEQRGGRVVVVDPRRTETAKAHQHLSVRPDTDAWLLLSMLQVIFAENLQDDAALAQQARGVEELRAIAANYPPEATEEITGVPSEQVREIARAFATAPSATAYGRTGACLGSHATAVSALIDVLTLVTGNLDRAGGTLFSRGPIPLEEVAELIGFASYNTSRSRLGDFPEVLGSFPATNMAAEITTPGKGQMRALFVTAGNPVLSTPNGVELEAALPQLDLMVGVDLYLNDTNKHADYVLPATTWLEREDFPIAVSSAAPTPFFQHSEAVVAARGEAKPEWEIFDEIARRSGIALFLFGPLRTLNHPVAFILRNSPVPLRPRPIIEALLRMGPYGDRFGLRRGGLNPKKLADNPHGVVLAKHAATDLLRHVVRYKDKRVHLDAPEFLEALRRLEGGLPSDPAFPLRMIGLRELRSHNSWMHNVPTLMKGKTRTHRARINPADAAGLGIVDGASIRLRSKTGVIDTVAQVTDEVGPGTVAVPHGWGHHGGAWERANKAGGANSNLLASSLPQDVEPISGMSHLNGIPVAVEALN